MTVCYEAENHSGFVSSSVVDERRKRKSLLSGEVNRGSDNGGVTVLETLHRTVLDDDDNRASGESPFNVHYQH